MSEVLAVINQKGGVGKTTTVANLSFGLANLGKKVLAIDLDPQSNLTAHLGCFNYEDISLEDLDSLSPPTIYEVFKGQKTLEEVICKVKNFDLVRSSLLLAAADLEFSGFVGRELLLSRSLQNVKDSYDIVIIDCPPNLGLLSLNALVASTDVIIPVQSEFLSLFGVRQLLDTIEQVRKIYNPNLKLRGVLVTMFDKRKKLSKAVLETIQNYFGELVFSTIIHENVTLAEAPSKGSCIFEYAPKSQGAEDYLQLCMELINAKENLLSA